MDFGEWQISDSRAAACFRAYIRASGDDGTGDMFSDQIQAAAIAYSAGIDEGKRLAGQTISELIISGIPSVETRFR